MNNFSEIRVRVLPDGRLDTENAALYLGVKTKTLAHWRMQGKGPNWVRVGSLVFYFKHALDAYISGKDAAA
ncbi:MAG: hypothetical protein CMM42_08470 [Rhodospirillaceae bacterium]|nr:hypothetical protein [Rhodospirillaceae bacterium]|tara:strand:+ start:343 stop:555 length:213 start_codon:yes stop_codon:yes gene_type:complete